MTIENAPSCKPDTLCRQTGVNTLVERRLDQLAENTFCMGTRHSSVGSERLICNSSLTSCYVFAALHSLFFIGNGTNPISAAFRSVALFCSKISLDRRTDCEKSCPAASVASRARGMVHARFLDSLQSCVYRWAAPIVMRESTL